MPVYMNEQRELIRASVREFADKELRPVSSKIDTEDAFPVELFKRAGELGFLDLAVPEEYGGAGMDLTSHCVVIEEIAKASATMAMCMIAHSGLAMTAVNVLGTPEQKAKWLEPLVTGRAIGVYCMTEPCGNGNDGAYSCKAVVDGGDLVINGTKIFCTNVGVADLFVVKAVTSDAKCSYIMVEKGTPGLNVGKIEDKVGWRGSSTGVVNFDNVRVPMANLLGPINQGVDIAVQCVFNEMIACGACTLGISEEALDITLNYTSHRPHKDGVCFPFKFDVMRVRMAEARSKINAIRGATYLASMDYDAGKPDFINSVMVKPYSYKAAEEITSVCMDLHGGVGVVRDAVIERLWRDAKVGLIGGGQYDNLLSTCGAMMVMGALKG